MRERDYPKEDRIPWWIWGSRRAEMKRIRASVAQIRAQLAEIQQRKEKD